MQNYFLFIFHVIKPSSRHIYQLIESNILNHTQVLPRNVLDNWTAANWNVKNANICQQCLQRWTSNL